MRAGKDPIGLVESLDDMGAFCIGQRTRWTARLARMSGLIQFFDSENRSLADDHGSFNDMFEFAHIARPGIR